MMNNRNSQIILVSDMKLDKDYKNVLSYSEQEMVNLCTQKQVVRGMGYSFLEVGANSINVQFDYATCLKADYIAFQNPYYSNKWFFAFVDSIKYLSEKATTINYTIDIFSTWYSYWSSKPCFIIREHTNDDTIGSNTLPENLELGDYVINGWDRDTNLDDLSYIIQVTEWTTSDNNPLATNYGGVWNVGGAYVTNNIREAINILQAYQDGRESAIINVYVIPTIIIKNSNTGLQYSGQDTPSTYLKEIEKPISLNGYFPKNKKLLTAPYQYLVLDNNNGISNNLCFEYFEGNICKFEIAGVPTVGGSIKCRPLNYKGITSFQQEGIMAGKFPVCGWVNDTYTNWLSQNAVNIGMGLVGSTLQLIGGIGLTATGVGSTTGISGILSGTIGIANSVGQIYQHSILPNSSKGNINGGDINTSSQTNCFYFLNMSIKQEYAKIIDDYFSREGYLTNRLKLPNITGRANYNYVQIASSENIGYSNESISIPSSDMELINTIFRSGTTVWHNYNNLGNYSVDNSIV